MSENVTLETAGAQDVPMGMPNTSTEAPVVDSTATTPAPIDKTKLVVIKKKPEESLAVKMARQTTDYWTGPTWPKRADLVKPINLVLRGDGVWEIRKNSGGLFCVKKYDGKFPGFPKEDNHPFFKPAFGKIPYHCLRKIQDFFKDICDESKSEVYVQIFWGVENEGEQPKYFLYVPEQDVSSGSVKYKHDNEMETKHVLVCEIHSHNVMGAFFSGIDDEDEKSDRFYGVIGELNKRKPAITMSYVCGGKRQLIGVEHLFTEAPAEEQSYPQEWRKRITRGNSGISRVSQDEDYEGYAGWGYGYEQARAASTGAAGGSPSGAWNFQSAKNDDRPSGGSTSSQGGTSGSAQGNKSVEEVEQEIESQIRRARLEMDSASAIKPTNFLDGKSPTSGSSEVAVSNPFFRHGATARTAESNSSDAEYDEALVATVNQITDGLCLNNVRGLKMNKNEKKELFNSFVAGISADDLPELIEAISANNHDLILETLGLYGESPKDQTTGSDV